MLVLIRYWKPTLGIVLLLLGMWVGHGLGSASGDKRAAKAELALSYMERDVAQKAALAEAAARQTEHRMAEALAEVSSRYEAEINDAKARSDSVNAALLAGNLRLRHEIAAYATASLSREAAASGIADPAAQRGAELVAAAVAVGATCDARQAALIQAYEVVR